MHTRLRIRLLAVGGLGVPTIVKDGEERLDLVLLADGQEIVHTLLQSLRVVLIDYTAQINTQGVKAQLLGPTQLLVDLVGFISVLAPHLDLIDRTGIDVIDTRQPRQLRIPSIGLFLTPALSDRRLLRLHRLLAGP